MKITRFQLDRKRKSCSFSHSLKKAEFRSNLFILQMPPNLKGKEEREQFDSPPSNPSLLSSQKAENW
jgi:hypothetical protein